MVAGPIIYQIEALFKLYKAGATKPNNLIFKAEIHMFSTVLEKKKL